MSPKRRTHPAHQGLTGRSPIRGDPPHASPPTCSERTENTYPGDDQRLVEVYAPGESEAPGRRAREDHVLGHGALGAASSLGALAPRDWGAARGGPAHGKCPREGKPLRSPESALGRIAAGELYPRSPVTSLACPPPHPLPPRRAPTLEERDAPDPGEFTDQHRLGAASQTFGRALEEASGYSLP